MREDEVALMLRTLRFTDPQYAYLPHVREGTGAYAGRTADAIAMGVWPSRGFELHGIEIKCSRSDWLREVRNPAKADGLFAYMDRWWLVTSDKAIVHPGELPPTWGWLSVMGTRIVSQVEAPKLEPKPITHVFLAAILRQASRTVFAEDDIARIRNTADHEGYQRGVREAHRDAAAVEGSRAQQNAAAITQFKEVTGIDLTGQYDFQVGPIGDIVNWFRDYQQPGASLLTGIDSLERAANETLATIAKIREDKAVPQVFSRKGRGFRG